MILRTAHKRSHNAYKGGCGKAQPPYRIAEYWPELASNLVLQLQALVARPYRAPDIFLIEVSQILRLQRSGW